MSVDEINSSQNNETNDNDITELDITDLRSETSGKNHKKSNKKNDVQKSNEQKNINKNNGQRKKKKSVFKTILYVIKKLKVLIILAVLATLGFYGYKQYSKMKAMQAAMKNKATQETAVIERRDITESITTTGTVMSAESRTLSSTIKDTKITSVNCKEGDYVEEGDILVTFSVEDINRTISDLKDDINKKEKTTAIDATGNTREYYYSYGTESMTMRDLQQAIDERQTDLNKACEEYGKASAELAEAEQELENWQLYYGSEQYYYDLYMKQSEAQKQGKNGETDGIPDQSAELTAKIESAKTKADSAYEKQEEAQKNLDKAKQDLSDEVYKGSNSLAKQTESYEKNIITQDDATEDLQRQLESYQDSLSDYVVVAPISGIVTSMNVEEANGFSGGDMLTIQDCSTYYVCAEIDEYDIPDIKIGQRVVIKTDATRDDELEGEVTYIAPTATSAQGSTDVTFAVKIKINTTDDRLMLGMSAKLNIIVNEKNDVLTVPYDAISENENGESVIRVIDEAFAKSESVSNNKKVPRIVIEGEEEEDTDVKPMRDDSSEKTDELKTKEVVVEVGMEGDYYTEISSSQISEGMQVLINEFSAGSGNSDMSSMMGPDMPGMGGGPQGPGGF